MSRSSTLLALYLSCARAAQPIPAGMEPAMIVTAKKDLAGTGGEVLAALAQRSDLLPASAAAISKITAAKVKAAWLTRPGLSFDDMSKLIKGEKRATVLASVAASPEATPDLLEALSSDERPTLAWAVVENPKTPSSALVRSLVTLANSEKQTGYEHTAKVSELIKARTDLHDELAAKLEKAEHLQLLVTSNLSSASYERLAFKLVLDPVAQSLTRASNDYYARVAIDRATVVGFALLENASVSGDTQVSVAKSLLAVANGADRNREFTPDRVQNLLLLAGSPAERASAQAIVNETKRRIELARSSVDPDELSELIDYAELEVSTARKRNPYYGFSSGALSPATPLLNALSTNMAMPLGLSERILPMMSNTSALQYVLNRLPSASTDDEYLFLASATFRLQAEVNQFASLAKDKEEFYLALVRFAVEQKPGSREYAWMMRRLADASVRFSASTLSLLPAKVLFQNPPPLMGVLIADALGDDPSAWETLDVLASDFEGSLDDLLVAARELS